jgi:lysophospholipase L1-like esterase
MNGDRLLVALSPLARRMPGHGAAVRLSQFDELPPARGGLVFLGDSITRGCIWNEWFPEHLTFNRGIDGDTIDGVLSRLDSAVVEPKVVSLLIGTNDLSGLGGSRAVPEIADKFEDLVKRIRVVVPSAGLIVNSAMPRTAWFAPRLCELNGHYRRIADDAGATYVDLWPTLADPSGALHAEFTRDGLHLTGLGYRAWVNVLRPHLVAELDGKR